MDIELFKELLDRYLLGTLSEEESGKFSLALDQPECVSELEKVLEGTFIEDAFEGEENPERQDRLAQLLKRKIETFNIEIADRKRRSKIILFKKLAAASVALFIIAGIFYFTGSKPAPEPLAITENNPVKKINDALPGHQGATLSLSDGTVIVLDSAQNGTLAIQGNMQVVKENGQILYKGNNGEILYNNINTDKGRQWSVVLPDGSKVWLNAGSSIHYPLTFSGKERVVNITGEAYFEVAHNSKLPFKVRVSGSEIEVLGTHFNVNAYQDEDAMRTTLLEGAISLNHGNSKKIISPGQEASILNNGSEIKVSAIDVQNAIAWKNGYFSFHSADLQGVMRQLVRWYDIEVVYPDKVPHFEFEGSIDRNIKLSAVLRILEKTGVHFEIRDNKKLMILP